MRKLGSILLLLFCLLQSSTAAAQGNIVQVISGNANFLPPYSTKLSDWSSPSTGGNIVLNLLQLDNQEPVTDVFIQVTVTGQGITLQTPISANIPAITLVPGNNRLMGNDLAAYFNLNNLNIVGINRGVIQQSNSVPAGLYTFTFQVFDYTRRDQALSSQIIRPNVPLSKNLPPILNLPENEATLFKGDNEQILFDWQSVANASITQEYDFKLVHVPPGMNPNQAINNSSTPIIQTTVTNGLRSFRYDPTVEVQLVRGENYAWQVTVRDVNGIFEFENFGRSEVFIFNFGKPYIGPDDIFGLVLNTPLDSIIEFTEEEEEVRVQWHYTGGLNPADFVYNYVELKIVDGTSSSDFKWAPIILRERVEASRGNTNQGEFIIEAGILKPMHKYKFEVAVYVDDIAVRNELSYSVASHTAVGNNNIASSGIRDLEIALKDYNYEIVLEGPNDEVELPIDKNNNNPEDKSKVRFNWNVSGRSFEQNMTLSSYLEVYEGAYENTEDLVGITPLFSEVITNTVEPNGGRFGYVQSYRNGSMQFEKDTVYTWRVRIQKGTVDMGSSSLRTFRQSFSELHPIVAKTGYDSPENMGQEFIRSTDRLAFINPYGSFSPSFEVNFFEVTDGNIGALLFTHDVQGNSLEYASFVIPNEVFDESETQTLAWQVTNVATGAESNVKFIQTFPANPRITITAPVQRDEHEELIEITWDPLPYPVISYELTLHKQRCERTSPPSQPTWQVTTEEYFMTDQLSGEVVNYLLPQDFLKQGGKYRFQLIANCEGGQQAVSDTTYFIITKASHLYDPSRFAVGDDRENTVIALNGERAFTQEHPPILRWNMNGSGARKFELKVVDLGTTEWFTRSQFDEVAPLYVKEGIDAFEPDNITSDFDAGVESSAYSHQPPATYNGDSLFNYFGVNKYYYSVLPESTNIYEDYNGTIQEIAAKGSIASFYTVGGNVVFTKAGPVFIDIDDVNLQDGSIVVADGTTGILKTHLNPAGIEVTLDQLRYDATTQEQTGGKIHRTFSPKASFTTSGGRVEYKYLEITADEAFVTGQEFFQPSDPFFNFIEISNPERKINYIHAEHGLQDVKVVLENKTDLTLQYYSNYAFTLNSGSVIDLNPIYEQTTVLDQTKLSGNFSTAIKDASDSTLAYAFNELVFSPSASNYLLNQTFAKDYTLMLHDNDFFEIELEAISINASQTDAIFTAATDYELRVKGGSGFTLNEVITLGRDDQSDLVFNGDHISFTANHTLDRIDVDIEGFTGFASSLNLEVNEDVFINSFIGTSIIVPAFHAGTSNELSGVQMNFDEEGFITRKTIAENSELAFQLRLQGADAKFIVKNGVLSANSLTVNGDLQLVYPHASSGEDRFTITAVNGLMTTPAGGLGVNNQENGFYSLTNSSNASVGGIPFEASHLYFGNIGGSEQYTAIGLFGTFALGFEDASVGPTSLWFKSSLRQFDEVTFATKPTQAPGQSIRGGSASSGGGGPAGRVSENISELPNEIPDLEAPIVQINLPGLNFAAEAINITNETYGKALYCRLMIPFDFFDKSNTPSEEGIGFSYLMGEAPEGFDYWFAEVQAVRLEKPITLPGKIEINGFVGRLYHHMRHDSEGGLSDVAYIPSETVYYGGYAGALFQDGYGADNGTKGKFFVGQAGVDISVKRSGDLEEMRLDGEASLGNLTGDLANAANIGSGFTVGFGGGSADFGLQGIRDFNGLLHAQFNASYNFSNNAFLATLDVETDGLVLCGGGSASLGINHSGYDYFFRLGSRDSPVGLYPCIFPFSVQGWLALEKQRTSASLDVSIGSALSFDLNLSTGKVNIGFTSIEAYARTHMSILAGGEVSISENSFSLNSIEAEAALRFNAGIRYLVLGEWRSYDFAFNANANVSMNFQNSSWTASTRTELKVWRIRTTRTISASGNNFNFLDALN